MNNVLPSARPSVTANHHAVGTILMMAVICSARPMGTHAAEEATPAIRWSWLEKPGSSVALIDNRHAGQIVWKFNYAAELTTPFFDPLAVAGGPSISWNQPPDHAWHHGLWFSWKDINGIEYWQHVEGTDRPEGTTAWSHVCVNTSGEGAATIQLDLTYSPPGAQSLLGERRTIELSAPDASGSYHIDWIACFSAGDQPVVLDRVPIPPHPQGANWGGFGGLSVRFDKQLAERQLVAANGPVAYGPDGIARFNSPAVDYNGVINGQPVGLAVLDAPANPRHPVSWYAIASDMSYLNPAILTYAPLKVEAGETLELRYRLVVHAGRWDAGKLRSVFAEFSPRDPP
jgi:hypothetical protein